MKTDRKQKIIDAGIFNQVVLQIFPEAKETKNNQLLVRCPFHDDQNPSLSVNSKTGAFNCFACPATGNFFDLYMQAKSVDFKTALIDLEKIAGINQIAKSSEVKQFPQVVATFHYHDENGNRKYHKKRYEPGFNSGRSKSFAFYHMENGKEKKGRGGDPLLYNLHLLLKADIEEPFFVVEGEAKADALVEMDFVATSLDSGGQSGKGSSWRAGFKKYFKARDVFILPDNDETGETYAVTIADNILSVAKSVKILRLPGLPPKGDILDWLKINGAGIE